MTSSVHAVPGAPRQEDHTAPHTDAGDAAVASRTRAGRLEFLDTVRGVAALVVAALFTPTYVVAWQLWGSRMSAQRRSLGPRPVPRVVVPGPRRPTADPASRCSRAASTRPRR